MLLPISSIILICTKETSATGKTHITGTSKWLLAFCIYIPQNYFASDQSLLQILRGMKQKYNNNKGVSGPLVYLASQLNCLLLHLNSIPIDLVSTVSWSLAKVVSDSEPISTATDQCLPSLSQSSQTGICSNRLHICYSTCAYCTCKLLRTP